MTFPALSRGHSINLLLLVGTALGSRGQGRAGFDPEEGQGRDPGQGDQVAGGLHYMTRTDKKCMRKKVISFLCVGKLQLKLLVLQSRQEFT